MKPPESHIKSCQPKNWAKYFPYSLYRVHWKTWIFGSFFPHWDNMQFRKTFIWPISPNFHSGNMCLLTLQGNALLWSHFVLGWVQRNSNFGSSDRRLMIHNLNLSMSGNTIYCHLDNIGTMSVVLYIEFQYMTECCTIISNFILQSRRCRGYLLQVIHLLR